MTHRFQIIVQVEVERDSGRFASRDEMTEQIIEAIESADPGSLDGLGADGDSSYSIVSWEVMEG